METTRTLSMTVFDPAIQHAVLNPLITKGTPCPHSHSARFGSFGRGQECLQVELFDGDEEICDAVPIGIIKILVPPSFQQFSPLEITFSLNNVGELSIVGNVECQLDSESILWNNPTYLVQSLLRADATDAEPGLKRSTRGTITGSTLLSSITVCRTPDYRRIELIVADLRDVTEELDVLVVSAYPDDYTPVYGSAIAALAQRGVSVAELASRREIDLRQIFSCWMSAPLKSVTPGIPFGRVLCYEPRFRGTPSETVGDIFRCLAPFVGSEPFVKTIGMPLVAAGHQRESPVQMLRLIVEAAARWIATGMPIDCVKLFVHPRAQIEHLCREFNLLKADIISDIAASAEEPQHDYFLSYAHDNVGEADWLQAELLRNDPGLRIFLDRNNLKPGTVWQQEIYEAIDDSRRVLALLSPSYLNSKVCLEEFNIAMFRHRESNHSVLFPLLLYSARLPTYMKLLQHFDCREFDHEKLNKACMALLNATGDGQ